MPLGFRLSAGMVVVIRGHGRDFINGPVLGSFRLDGGQGSWEATSFNHRFSDCWLAFDPWRLQVQGWGWTGVGRQCRHKLGT